MEVLVLDGKNYVKASKAASDLGYATDYVGQLCRSGQVDAHLIGRSWYVNQDLLSTHKIEKKRTSRVKARKHAKKAIEEHRLKVNSRDNYKNVDIQYEKDSTELMPETRKVEVVSEAEGTGIRGNVVEEGKQETVIENKGNKTIMSGDIEVMDVTDELEDTDTTFLFPTKARQKPVTKKEISKEVRKEIKIETESTEVVKKPALRPSFEERLRRDAGGTPEEVVDTKQESVEVLQEIEPDTQIQKPQTRGSLYPYLLIIILVLTLTGLSFGLENELTYSVDDELTSVLRYNFDTIKQLIKSL